MRSDDGRGDGQPQPGSRGRRCAVAGGGMVASTIERLKDVSFVFLGYTFAVIDDAYDDLPLIFLQLHGDLSIRSGTAMLECIVEQDKEKLFDAFSVGLHAQTLACGDDERDAAIIGGAQPGLFDTFHRQFDDVNILRFERLTVVKARNCEYVIDQRAHTLGLRFHQGEYALCCLGIVFGSAQKQIGETAYRSERCTQLMGGIREKLPEALVGVVLYLLSVLKAFCHFAQTASKTVNFVLRRQAQGQTLALLKVPSCNSLSRVGHAPKRA